MVKLARDLKHGPIWPPSGGDLVREMGTPAISL